MHNRGYRNGQRRVNLYSLGLLDENADVNAKDKWGDTPLVKAVKTGNRPVIRALLSRGADDLTRDKHSGTALYIAVVWHSSLPLLRLLLRRRVRIDNAGSKGRPLSIDLFDVYSYGRFDVVEFLLRKGADIDGDCGVGGTALVWAADWGMKIFAQKLIDAGANVNVSNTLGKTPLMYAAESASTDLVRVLLDAGADATAQDKQGMTALDWTLKTENPAIWHDEIDKIRELLEQASNKPLNPIKPAQD